MDFIANVFGWLAVAYFVSIPFIWIWVFYHKIKCRKMEKCSNRKCKYWQYCRHNYVERTKDELELRKQILLHSLGLTEEKTDEIILITSSCPPHVSKECVLRFPRSLLPISYKIIVKVKCAKNLLIYKSILKNFTKNQAVIYAWFCVFYF